MLPKDLMDIVEKYVEAFQIFESLPEVSAIRRLILNSNKNLMRIATAGLDIPVSVMMELILADEFSPEYVHLLTENQDLLNILDDVITTSMMTHYSTPALFWLFIQKTPNLYFGPYGVMFEQSLLFKLISVITSV